MQLISIKSYEPFVLEAIVIKDIQLKTTTWEARATFCSDQRVFKLEWL